MIRRARPDDLDAVVDLAVESVSIDPIEGLVIDREAMRDTAEQCLQPAHYLWVSEIDGEVVAALAGFVQPGFWFHKLQCSVLLHYSRKPGEYVRLVRHFAGWVKGRPGIKMAICELEPRHGERLIRFWKGEGFERESTNLTYVRGVK